MTVENKSINYILSMNNTSFYIPPFQRAYAWGGQEIDRYFRDISRIIDSERDISERDKLEHFFGVLVFKPETDGFASREVVVDGQQRLTTTLLLLIALRDCEPDDDKRMKIENRYLKNSESTYGDKIKLKQVTSDWDAYRALIRKDEQLPGKVTDGYNRFHVKVRNADYTSEEYVKALSRVNVACVFLDERPHKGEDPQIIFETLNSLGKPLSFADLIRNYVLLGMESDKQTTVFEDIWHPGIEDVLKENSSNFFRDYMQFKESKSFKVVSNNNTKELYALFTEFIEREFGNNKRAFIDDIVRYVPWYQWIIEVNPTVQISADTVKNKVIIELLRNIFHDISAVAFKAPVLGLLEFHQCGYNGKKLPDDQLIEALTAIRTYLIRRRVMRLTQGENKDIVKLCDDFRGNEKLLENAKSELFKLLSKCIFNLRIPNDLDIAAELQRTDFYNGLNKYSKFILGKIEEHLSKVSVDFRDSKITIEHIMPQTVDSNWKHELGDDWERIHKTYVHNIGNLILTEFNSEMGKKPLKDKKEKLISSNLQYRNDVLHCNAWNGDSIVVHQTTMIERFLLTFPLPPHMQQADNWDTSDKNKSQDVFSPLNDELNVTGKSPKVVLIDDEIYEVSSWQDVYITFLRWLKESNPIVFGMILSQQQDDSRTKHQQLMTKKQMLNIIVDTPEMKDRYKRLSDGVVYSKVEDEDAENPIYVFINQSADGFMSRIRSIMQLAEMAEESVTIELKA
jgi:uncharacterized protein with ParB-like and HNH nuclease domain